MGRRPSRDDLPDTQAKGNDGRAGGRKSHAMSRGEQRKVYEEMLYDYEPHYDNFIINHCIHSMQVSNGIIVRGGIESKGKPMNGNSSHLTGSMPSILWRANIPWAVVVTLRYSMKRKEGLLVLDSTKVINSYIGRTSPPTFFFSIPIPFHTNDSVLIDWVLSYQIYFFSDPISLYA